MTIPRIEVLEHNQVITVLRCTGCDQESSYADYLTDLTPNEYLRQCIREASEHDCFVAGRVGYVVTPPEQHERDNEGRCLTCLRFGEKQNLIRRAQRPGVFLCRLPDRPHAE